MALHEYDWMIWHYTTSVARLALDNEGILQVINYIVI